MWLDSQRTRPTPREAFKAKIVESLQPRPTTSQGNSKIDVLSLHVTVTVGHTFVLIVDSGIVRMDFTNPEFGPHSPPDTVQGNSTYSV